MINEITDASFAFAVMEALPDAVLWVMPVYNTGNEIVDFQVRYANKRGNEVVNHPSGALSGLCLLKDGIPSRGACAANFQNFLQVYQSGTETEFSFLAAHSGLHIETQRKKFRGGVLSITRDRQAQRAAEEKEAEKTRLLRGIVAHAPAGIMVYEAIRDRAGAIADFRMKLFNDVVQELTVYTQEERSRMTLKEILRLHGREAVFVQYVQTVETGAPFSFEFHFDQLQKWLYYRVVKLEDGFMIVVTDITETKLIQQAVQRQSAYINSILNASLNAIVTMEAVRDGAGTIVDYRYMQVNQSFLDMVGLQQEQVKGQTMLRLFPYVKDAGIFEAFRVAIETGAAQRLEVYYKGENLDAWYDVSISRLDGQSAVGTFSDITQSKRSALLTEQQKALLDNILRHSPSGISVTEVLRDAEGRVVDGRTIIANEASERYTGLPMAAYLSQPISQFDPNILQSTLFLQAINTLETGTPFQTQYFFEPTGRWLEVSIARMDNDRLINVFTDITTTKVAQLEVERSSLYLQQILNIAQTGIFLFMPVRDEGGRVADFRFRAANRRLAGYVGQEPEALIGELGSRWFPGYQTNGLFERYRHTYETGNPDRFDFHYYADNIDVWLDIQVTRLEDEVLVTFSDFTPLKRLQLQLEKSVEELQRSNTNLEEFAYAASHDLKEPIRKIHFFADRLQERFKERMDAEEVRMFSRMQAATERMHTLVDDLLSYSQVSHPARATEEVNLASLVELVTGDLELEIQEKAARITAEGLPVVHGHARQLQQLFQNLLSNALKYSRPGLPPEVTISCRTVPGRQTGLHLSAEEQGRQYFAITVADNGIGFDQAEAERIFNVFQRLHSNAEYRGTGVGLSIARKVAENHQGAITARSRPGEGAAFCVFLPATNGSVKRAAGAGASAGQD